LLVLDEACAEPITTGANLSRSVIKTFKHNDMADLERVLAAVARDDAKMKRDSTQQRRFIVVEGLYRNTGDLCPLPELLKIKEKYCYRLILDESLSFGTVGSTGRGVCELYGVSVKAVEILTVAMDTALGSVGGLCVGNRDVVDHQRLSGAGYCFSASAPPFLAAAAVEALQVMEREPQLLALVQSNSELLFAGLSRIEGWHVLGKVASPVLHLAKVGPAPATEQLLVQEEGVMRQVAQVCLQNGVAVVASRHASDAKHSVACSLKPTVRVCVNSGLSQEDVYKAVQQISLACEKCV
jgi:serine palmitoyltransferase